MADKLPWLATESGCTYVTGGSPDPKVNLSGTATTLSTYPTRTFAEAATDSNTDFADTNTCSVLIVDEADADTWELWENAVWNDDTTDYLDLSSASKIGQGPSGALSNSDTVTVYAEPALGGSSVPGVTREFYVDAAAMVPRETNGAVADTEEYATNDVNVDHYLFDSITEEGVQFKLAMPDGWDRSTIKVKVFWDAATDASADDGVTWGVSARAVSNDDAIDGAFSASVDTDDAVIAVGDLHVTAASSAITVSGTPAIGDLILFEITRVVGDANDDMAEDAKLFGIQIQYTESTTTPSIWS